MRPTGPLIPLGPEVFSTCVNVLAKRVISKMVALKMLGSLVPRHFCDRPTPAASLASASRHDAAGQAETFGLADILLKCSFTRLAPVFTYTKLAGMLPFCSGTALHLRSVRPPSSADSLHLSRTPQLHELASSPLTEVEN